MKIYYLADVEERKYEGRSQTAILLKKRLEKKGFKFVDHPSKADLIQVHSSGIADSFKAAKLKKRYKIPVVYTLYSLSKTEPFNHFRNHFAQRFYLRPRKTSFILSYSAVLPLKLRGIKLKKIDCVITPSYFVKKRLYDNSKVIRIGINLKKYHPFKKNKFNLRDNLNNHQKLKIAYFGHPSAYKGVLDFARASRKLFPHYECFIYISDTSQKMYRNLKKINPHINLVGHVDDMPKVYNEVDIVVLPYRSHLAGVANPLVLVEAMACGKPIITTNFSYIKEISQGSCLHVRPYNTKQIVSAIKFLAKNPSLREKLGKKAREIAKKEFDQNKMVDDYVKLYNSFKKI